MFVTCSLDSIPDWISVVSIVVSAFFDLPVFVLDLVFKLFLMWASLSDKHSSRIPESSRSVSDPPTLVGVVVLVLEPDDSVVSSKYFCKIDFFLLDLLVVLGSSVFVTCSLNSISDWISVVSKVVLAFLYLSVLVLYLVIKLFPMGASLSEKHSSRIPKSPNLDTGFLTLVDADVLVLEPDDSVIPSSKYFCKIDFFLLGLLIVLGSFVFVTCSLNSTSDWISVVSIGVSAFFDWSVFVLDLVFKLFSMWASLSDKHSSRIPESSKLTFFGVVVLFLEPEGSVVSAKYFCKIDFFLFDLLLVLGSALTGSCMIFSCVLGEVFLSLDSTSSGIANSTELTLFTSEFSYFSFMFVSCSLDSTSVWISVESIVISAFFDLSVFLLHLVLKLFSMWASLSDKPSSRILESSKLDSDFLTFFDVVVLALEPDDSVVSAKYFCKIDFFLLGLLTVFGSFMLVTCSLDSISDGISVVSIVVLAFFDLSLFVLDLVFELTSASASLSDKYSSRIPESSRSFSDPLTLVDVVVLALAPLEGLPHFLGLTGSSSHDSSVSSKLFCLTKGFFLPNLLLVLGFGFLSILLFLLAGSGLLQISESGSFMIFSRAFDEILLDLVGWVAAKNKFNMDIVMLMYLIPAPLYVIVVYECAVFPLSNNDPVFCSICPATILKRIN